MIKCNSCKGTGQARVVVLSRNDKGEITKSISTCLYCFSRNISNDYSGEPATPPAWYKQTIIIEGEEVPNVIGLSLFALK